MNGAQLLCETLLTNDIDVCFANPGTSEMHFVAALDQQPRMRCVLGLFEGVVTGAADGYARMARKPAATLLHLGSGLGNGLANLHNARRARTPMVNVVGDHARHHLAYDAPLTSDIRAIASAVSMHVQTAASPESLRDDMAQSIAVALQPPGAISTLILPADIAWSEVPADLMPPKIAKPASACVEDVAIQKAAQAIRSGRALLLLSGDALFTEPLMTAYSICQATGAEMLAETANARIQRGRLTVPVSKLPYQVDAAIERLRDVEHLILIGAGAPVAFFAYPGKPSTLAPIDCQVHELATPGHDLADTLHRLRLALDVKLLPEPPAVAPTQLADAGSGPLNARAVCLAVAALLPEGAIVSDESITQGSAFYTASFGSAPHDYLQLTGGAIGAGLPLATGAAVACPDRQVVSLQADGSAMYTLQALWTQAREKLKCLTVIFANRRYAILHHEMRNVGVEHMGQNASNMLSIGDPDIGWPQLAASLGVPARSASTVEDFIEALREGLASPGPFLIEAVLP